MAKGNVNRYNEKFKLKLALANKQSIAEECRSFGVSQDPIDRWLTTEAGSHDGDRVRIHQIETEVRQLRRENDNLKSMIEILKKAAVIYSQSQTKVKKQ